MTESPHYSLEAEEAVIYSAMGDLSQAAELTRRLNDKDFYVHEHTLIWGAIGDLVDRGIPVDIVTLTNELQLAGFLTKAGGSSKIGSLYDRPVLAKNYLDYAEIVANCSLRRQLKAAAEKILSDCQGPDDVSEVLGDAEAAIMAVGKAGGVTGKPERLSATLTASFGVIQSRMEAGEDFVGLPMGYPSLDRMTGGLQPGNLVLIAARPSMGKTALALNIAANAALDHGARVAFFSLEMSRDEVTHRILSSEAKVDSSKLRNGQLNGTDWELLTDAAASLAKADLYIDETGGMSHGEIRARCHALSLEKPLDLIIVDYIQLMRMPNTGSNRNIQVGDISGALKALAKEMKCPVVALSQLSRAAASNEKEIRPALHHLRDSGSLEQDADIVMFVHRPEMMGRQGLEGYAEIIVAKQRNGPVGGVDLQFAHEHTLFYEPDHRYDV